MHIRDLEHILTTVAATLRTEFPDDFYKRCIYAATGIRALMFDAGVEAEIVGGDFVGFVVSRDGRRASLQGFANSPNSFAHYWVEACGRLIDLGPHFLPDDASFDAAPMPAVAWELAHPLPSYLRYRTLARSGRAAVLSSDPAINARCYAFAERCRNNVSHSVRSKFPTWVVTGPSSVDISANRRTPWAVGALRFARLRSPQSPPF